MLQLHQSFNLSKKSKREKKEKERAKEDDEQCHCPLYFLKKVTLFWLFYKNIIF
uniref:Uncharacterized protein n=1 Tax=Nelumbo nucifera TaxID=4432 RepID=A0A822Y2F3_NELNU|nr:TPA_asm: hypothetical protein HUJ06_027189 [Nelumbo nucifera]